MTDRQLHEIHIQPCPWCGYHLDRATNLDNRITARPRPGDITLCLDCGEWCTFSADLTLSKPTEVNLLEIGENPNCRAVRAAWVRMNEERRLDAKQRSGKIKKRGAG